MEILLAAAVGVLAPLASPALDLQLTVRVYDTRGVPPEQIEQARATLDAVFRPAGIEVRWRDCPRTANDRDGDACDDPATNGDVILRLVSLPPNRRLSTADDALGYSRVEATRQTASLVTIFVDRVEATAIRISRDMGMLLGRVIAHEVGHALLGSGHAKTGLMRARWTPGELRSDAPGHWAFTERDIRSLQRTLLAGRQEP